jgi:hypothetical protein
MFHITTFAIWKVPHISIFRITALVIWKVPHISIFHITEFVIWKVPHISIFHITEFVIRKVLYDLIIHITECVVRILCSTSRYCNVRNVDIDRLKFVFGKGVRVWQSNQDCHCYCYSWWYSEVRVWQRNQDCHCSFITFRSNDVVVDHGWIDARRSWFNVDVPRLAKELGLHVARMVFEYGSYQLEEIRPGEYVLPKVLQSLSQECLHHDRPVQSTNEGYEGRTVGLCR